MKVSKVMTKDVIFLKKTDKIKDALKLFSKHHITGCPVVSRKKVIGMITQTDILNFIDVREDIQLPNSGFFDMVLSMIKGGDTLEDLEDSLLKAMELRVGEFMKKNVITIKKEDTVYKTARIMNKNKINRLPVVEDGKLVGIITRADIVSVLADM